MNRRCLLVVMLSVLAVAAQDDEQLHTPMPPMPPVIAGPDVPSPMIAAPTLEEVRAQVMADAEGSDPPAVAQEIPSELRFILPPQVGYSASAPYVLRLQLVEGGGPICYWGEPSALSSGSSGFFRIGVSSNTFSISADYTGRNGDGTGWAAWVAGLDTAVSKEGTNLAWDAANNVWNYTNGTNRVYVWLEIDDRDMSGPTNTIKAECEKPNAFGDGRELYPLWIIPWTTNEVFGTPFDCRTHFKFPRAG